MEGKKLAIAGVVGGVPAVLAGAMGASILTDLAIAGILGYAAWEFSPELQSRTAKFVPQITADRIPVLNKVDWKGVFAGTDEAEQKPDPHDVPKDEEPSDEQITARLREIGVSDEVVSDWIGEDDAVSVLEVQADDFAVLKRRNGKFEFSELLATGWRPSMKEIFLARLPDGTDVFVTVEQLVHVALSGATRNGKTSIIRQLLSQLVYVGCDCILLDPHFTPYDIDRDEDWTPFIPRLKFDPVECKEYARMEQIIEHTDTVIMAKRKKRRAQSLPVGKPIFLMIDEYPTVMANCPSIEGHIANLLREGAKYQIFLCIASHDFLVKTAFPSMGSGLRDQLKTVIHCGGNIHTVKELMDMEKVDRAEEATLGKGRVYLRCETHKQAGLAQTPWMNDEAIRELVGPSTYAPFEREVDTEDLEALDITPIEESVATLKAMPYLEYLKTAHWQRMRKPALAYAEYRCQMCYKNNLQLDVHHRTYERLGHEKLSDLTVLCHPCHNEFHDRLPSIEDSPVTRIVDTILQSDKTPKEPENSTSDGADRGSRIPEGWIEQDVEFALDAYRRCKNRDDVLKAMGRPQNDANRKALRIVLANAGLIELKEVIG